MFCSQTSWHGNTIRYMYIFPITGYCHFSWNVSSFQEGDIPERRMLAFWNISSKQASVLFFCCLCYLSGALFFWVEIVVEEHFRWNKIYFSCTWSVAEGTSASSRLGVVKDIYTISASDLREGSKYKFPWREAKEELVIFTGANQ